MVESDTLRDKACGAKAIREYTKSKGAAYTIPPKERIDALGLWIGIPQRKVALLDAFSRKPIGFIEFTRNDKSNLCFFNYNGIDSTTIVLK